MGIDWGYIRLRGCRAAKGEREAQRESLSIPTNRGGFTSLGTWILRQGAPTDGVVMESSGHYWFNPASHLRRQGDPVAVANPLYAKYFAKSPLQRNESEPADAQTCGNCDRVTSRESASPC